MDFTFDFYTRFRKEEAQFFYCDLRYFYNRDARADYDTTHIATNMIEQYYYNTCLEDVCIIACYEGDADVAKTLYQLASQSDEEVFTIDINVANAALQGGDQDTIDFVFTELQDTGITTLEEYQGSQVSLLHLATSAFQAEYVLKYLKTGESADVVDSRGMTPLYLACVGSNGLCSYEDVQALLYRGADPFDIDPYDPSIGQEARDTVLEHRERIFNIHKLAALGPERVNIHVGHSETALVLQGLVGSFPGDLVRELLSYV